MTNKSKLPSESFTTVLLGHFMKENGQIKLFNKKRYEMTYKIEWSSAAKIVQSFSSKLKGTRNPGTNPNIIRV